MNPMPYSKEFENLYRQIDPDISPVTFSKGETGFYASKHTYKEYQWFALGYLAALTKHI